ncbi:sensor histidine kinase [Dactylosporangium vinaceum]|uniref:histidine kinase n=1 Tax=Dactylosporangium vinaceum TaxID=53362 RepID=A0ABV5MQJ2_9ACTN|nr:sensor histidine kinase [Dactylosporangium vinaceum]UAB96443.1 sensor histidine kinase [Dactylosporangium vinaceum]
MVGLFVLGGIQVTNAVNSARDAGNARTLSITATSAVLFVHEIERELAETAALRQRGGTSGAALVTAQRSRTDQAASRFFADAAKAVEAVPALADRVRVAGENYGQLGFTRASIDNGTATMVLVTDVIYGGLADALLTVADAVPGQIEDIELSNAARALASSAFIEHYAAVERDLLRTIFSRGNLQPGDLGNLALIEGAKGQREAEFRRVSTDQQRQLYSNEVRGTDVDTADGMAAKVRDVERDAAGLKVDADAWFVAQSGVIRRVSIVSVEIADNLDVRADEIAVSASRRAWATGILTVLLALGALAIAIVLAVRTARRLNSLRGAALQVARRDLPDAINAVSAGSSSPAPSLMEGGRTAAEVTRGIAALNDEVGQVAEAFSTVHRTALRLAGEQAELRVDVGRMAEVLARRIRTLITRQLRLLDEFERDETDPDVLARLFALDHLAARLRRNGENLLVLSGGEPGRPQTKAVGLGAVITAAASEIEDFARVEFQPADLAIAGPVVGDLVHLLAELLENATAFSPPTEAVTVDARATTDGAMIRVHDQGIGILPARLAEINSRLAVPSVLSSAAAGTMGLHVVSHLAARHGIRVQLHASGSGTVAYVAIPHRLLDTVSALPMGRSAPTETIPAVKPPPSRPVQVPSTVGAPLGRAEQQFQPQRSQPQAPQIPQQRRPEPAPAPAPTPVAAGPSAGGMAPWFRPYLSGSSEGQGSFRAGGSTPPPATSRVQPGGNTPSRGVAQVAATPPANPPVRPPQYSAQTTWGSPGTWPPRPGSPSSSAGGGSMSSEQDQDLPRRRPGAQLAPETTAPPAESRSAAAVDPDQIRSRLSAFAEGVSAAARRSTSTATGQSSTPGNKES